MDFKLSDKSLKRIIIFGTGVFISYYAYKAYNFWKKRQFKSIDEGFEDVSKIEENQEKRILVLGLEHAGKSTIIAQITSGSITSSKNLNPTEGFFVSTMESKGICLNIWEIGGRENVRTYWPNFLQDTDVLVFVIDSSNVRSLPLAVKEVKWLLADERLADVPVLFIANKQDIPNSMPPEDVADVLDLGSLTSSKRKIRVLGCQTPRNSTTRHPSILEIEKILLQLVND